MEYNSPQSLSDLPIAHEIGHGDWFDISSSGALYQVRMNGDSPTYSSVGIVTTTNTSDFVGNPYMAQTVPIEFSNGNNREVASLRNTVEVLQQELKSAKESLAEVLELLKNAREAGECRKETTRKITL
jgi:hypothetical protein